MYWYYKYPMLAILALLLLGVGHIVWQSTRGTRAEAPAGQSESTVGEREAKESVPPSPGPDAPVPDAPVPEPPPLRPPPDAPAPPPLSPDQSALFDRLMAAARSRIAEGKLESGRNIALRAMQAEGVAEFSDDWYEAAEIVSRANSVFMNSGAPCSEKVSYTIRDGDNLTVIANRLGTTVQALQRLNPEMLGSASSRIYPGKTLSALKTDWSIRVAKSQFVLLLLDGDRLFKMYHVAVGRHDRTPVGTFEIVNKVERPDWTHPSGEVILYGDKRNVLGTRWLALRPTGTTDPNLRGFGIHGTWEPESIGTQASLGCVRMRNEEVNELYDFIPFPRAGRGTKVTIEN